MGPDWGSSEGLGRGHLDQHGVTGWCRTGPGMPGTGKDRTRCGTGPRVPCPNRGCPGPTGDAGGGAEPDRGCRGPNRDRSGSALPETEVPGTGTESGGDGAAPDRWGRDGGAGGAGSAGGGGGPRPAPPGPGLDHVPPAPPRPPSRPGAAPVPPAEPARIGPAWRGRGAPCSASPPLAACSAPCQVPGPAARGVPGRPGGEGGGPRPVSQRRGAAVGAAPGPPGSSARWWGCGRRVWGALPGHGSLRGAAPRAWSRNSGEVPTAPGAVAPAPRR